MVPVEDIEGVVQGSVQCEWIGRHAAPHVTVFEGVEIQPINSQMKTSRDNPAPKPGHDPKVVAATSQSKI